MRYNIMVWLLDLLDVTVATERHVGTDSSTQVLCIQFYVLSIIGSVFFSLLELIVRS